MTRRFVVGVLVLLLLALPQAQAAQTTRCQFGGPAPGFKAVRLDLPAGSSFLNTEILGARTPRVINTGSAWHLAQGVVVIRREAASSTIVAYRLRSEGSSPTGVTVRPDGTDAASVPEGAAPDVSFVHSWAQAVSSLPGGEYFAVAWGAGGEPAAGPRDTWGAAVEVEGAHTCAAVGAGELFDLEQNDFSGGAQVTAPGVALMQGASLEQTWNDRSLVVGMIDAAVQGAGLGDVVVSYRTPWGTGAVDRALRPFIGGAGLYRFEAEVTGLFPVVSINGLRIDLP